MYIEQIYTKCLAEATYYIESNGYAAIIDPLRDTEPYTELAKKRSAKIIYVFETHFHADFVSGHVDLAKKTGAKIVYGPTSLTTGFESIIAKDGEEFKLGNICIQLIHTPGHTMESSCYLLKDESGNHKALFTGDTLFIGDVGRPDLAQKIIAELTPEKLAGHLFDSLRDKIMPLDDDLIVYPGHGAGSACGKNMSKETTDTLGHQKKVNYALNPALSKENFITQVLEGLTPPPAYFPQDVLLNIKGYKSSEEIFRRASTALTSEAFIKCAIENDALIIDTREADVFARGFIPGSWNIGLDGNFAVWAGTLIPQVTQPILIVAEPGKEKEVFTRLSRVGYDVIFGYLNGGFETWVKDLRPFNCVKSVDVENFRSKRTEKNLDILDVRKENEFLAGHLEGAVNVPLDFIHQSKLKIDNTKTYYIYCAGGYRSMIFISLLMTKDINNLVNIRGGFAAIKNSGLFEEVTTSSCVL